MSEEKKLVPPRKDEKNVEPLGTPYGPHPNGVDAAAGGADSSPFENVPTGERVQEANESKPSRTGDDEHINTAP